MKPNLDCKVARYPNDAIRNTRLHTPPFGNEVKIILSSYKFINFPNYGGCYRAYGTRIDGSSYVWYLDKKINKIVEFDISEINNLTSRQRRFIKEVRAQLDEFLRTEFTCDGCIYRNKYLLTKQCTEIYAEAK